MADSQNNVDLALLMEGVTISPILKTLKIKKGESPTIVSHASVSYSSVSVSNSPVLHPINHRENRTQSDVQINVWVNNISSGGSSTNILTKNSSDPEIAIGSNNRPLEDMKARSLDKMTENSHRLSVELDYNNNKVNDKLVVPPEKQVFEPQVESKCQKFDDKTFQEEKNAVHLRIDENNKVKSIRPNKIYLSSLEDMREIVAPFIKQDLTLNKTSIKDLTEAQRENVAPFNTNRIKESRKNVLNKIESGRNKEIAPFTEQDISLNKTKIKELSEAEKETIAPFNSIRTSINRKIVLEKIIPKKREDVAPFISQDISINKTKIKDLTNREKEILAPFSLCKPDEFIKITPDPLPNIAKKPVVKIKYNKQGKEPT